MPTPLAPDPRNPAFYANPFAAYARFHAECPTFHWDAYGHRCFAGHKDVSGLLRDRRLGRQRTPWDPPPPRIGLEAFDTLERHSMLELEPPAHTKLRTAVNRSFVSRSLADMEPFVRRRATELVDALPDAASFDLLPAFATPLPVETIATLLGVPLAMTDRMLSWSHDMVAIYAFANDEGVERRANDAAGEFTAFIRGELGRANEGSLLAKLAANPNLSTDDAVATAILLLNAGHEATVHQIGNAVRALIDARDSGLDLGWWVADDERLERLVEECLRFAPPLHLFTRYAYEDISWTDATGGTIEIARNDTIGLLLGAANRDPRAFADPDRFDPTRERIDHVAFGGGIHFCLGAPLARMELRIALRTLFARYPKLKLAYEPVVADTFHFHGLERLVVTTG